MAYRGFRIHKTPVKKPDYDFIVEFLNDCIELHDGWELKFNSYKTPKLAKEERTVDVIPINKVVYIEKNPTIENYLSNVSLTVQSVAYDIEERKILGETGINSILSKTVGFNRLDDERHDRKKMSPENYLKYVADSLGFRIV